MKSSRPILKVVSGQGFICDSPVLSGTMASAIDSISKLIGDSQRHLVVTANVDHLIDLSLSSPLLRAYDAASIRVLDGMPVVWLMKFLGATNIHRITGADMIFDLTEASATQGWRIAIAGGNSDVLDRAIRNLKMRFPEATVSGVEMPYMRNPDDHSGAKVVAKLEALSPDIVFLCLGAPKQELWFLHWREQLPPAIYIGAGAAVDFAAGTKKRAPILVQKSGLEWTWRVFQEFRRLAPRYLIKGPRFLSLVFESMLFSYKSKRERRK